VASLVQQASKTPQKGKKGSSKTGKKTHSTQGKKEKNEE
jgi:hypothetical protein